jgi:putative transposase
MTTKSLIDPASVLPIQRQCGLIGLARSSYYAPQPKVTPTFTGKEEHAMRAIDRIHLEHPCYGARRISRELERKDKIIMARRKVAKLMGTMGIRAIYPHPNTSAPGKQHPKFPYLLKNKVLRFPNQVWSTDITYVPIGKGHMYLSVVIDWFSRYIVSWRLHDTLEACECVACVRAAFEEYGIPAYFNTDQGVTYSSNEFIALLAGEGVAQSMDGKGRWVDNVINERAFRSIKQECVYINEYSTPNELRALIGAYIADYNNDRLHSSLDYDTPAEWYFSGIGSKEFGLAA